MSGADSETVVLKVPPGTKAWWVAQSQAEGKKLSEWVVARVNPPPPLKRRPLITYVDAVTSPHPQVIKAARKAASLTASMAADLVHICNRPQWSAYERGMYQMPVAAWELFLLKTGLHPTKKVVDIE